MTGNELVAKTKEAMHKDFNALLKPNFTSNCEGQKILMECRIEAVIVNNLVELFKEGSK